MDFVRAERRWPCGACRQTTPQRDRTQHHLSTLVRGQRMSPTIHVRGISPKKDGLVGHRWLFVPDSDLSRRPQSKRDLCQASQALQTGSWLRSHELSCPQAWGAARYHGLKNQWARYALPGRQKTATARYQTLIDQCFDRLCLGQTTSCRPRRQSRKASLGERKWFVGTWFVHP